MHGNTFTTTVRVRWSDLDSYGHVNNAAVVTLLEEARVDWLFVAAAEQGIDQLIQGLVVAGLTVNYRRQLGQFDDVVVQMGVSTLSAASFVIDYRLTVGDHLAVDASTTMVPVNPDTMRPRRLIDAERAYFARYTVA